VPVVEVDGLKVFVKEGTQNPEEAAREKVRRGSRRASTLGDVGRGIAAGLVGIPQGIGTLGTTIIDGIFDTDLTQSLNNYFEEFKPDTNSTAGHIAQYLTQFGIPGLGVASLVSKAGRTAQILSAGAADAAVATDDVETLSDLFFDEESDEERFRKLRGSEAAAARLADRLGVFAETAALVGTVPIALQGIAKGASETAGAIGVATAPLARAVASKVPGTKYIDPVEAISKKDETVMNKLMEKFTFQGALKSDDIAQIKEASSQAEILVAKQVERDFGSVIDTVSRAGKSGVLNNNDKQEIAKAIGDYYAPKVRISYESPSLINDRVKMKQVQDDALEKIKSFEGDKIKYDELGISEDRTISKILQDQRQIINLNSEYLADNNLNSVLVPDELKQAIKTNQGFYTQRAYKALTDNTFKVDPEQRLKAIEELTKSLGDPKKAEQAFEEILSGKMDVFAFDNPKATVDALAGNIKLDILKGRTLDDLPATRRALGEIGGYLGKDWQETLANTQLQAYNTARKISALTGRVKMFSDLKKLNDGARTYGIKPFIFNQSDLGVTGKAPGDVFRIPNSNKEFVVFDDRAGDLSGMVASKRFHDSLLDAQNTGVTQIANSLGAPYKTFLGIKSAAQYNKTVLSPSAQIRNPFGGAIMTFAAGNMKSGGNFLKSLTQVFNRFGSKSSDDTFKAEVKMLDDLGLIEQKSSAFIGEIEDLAKFANESNFVGKISNSKTMKAFRNSKFNKYAQKAYTGSDDTIRAYNFYQERDKLFRALVKHGDTEVPVVSAKNKLNLNASKVTANSVAGSNLDKLANRFQTQPIKKGNIKKFLDDAVEDGDITKKGSDDLYKFLNEESAQLAKNNYQNYSRTGEIIKDLAKLPIGNFAAFPSEIIRTTGNIAYRAAQELASNNPELQKMGMRRATSAMVATTALPASLTTLGLTLTGSDRDQLDAYRRSFAAPWDKTATLVPLATDDQGKITQMINFSYTNPYDYLSRPISRLIAEVEEGNVKEEDLINSLSQGMVFGIGELVSPFGTPSIASKLMYESFTGQTETGRRLYRASDTFGDKLTKGFVHNLEGIAPPVLPFRITTDPASNLPLGLSTPVKDFPRAVFGSTGLLGDNKLKTSRGTKIDPAEVLIQGFSGLKVIRPTIEKNLRYKGFEANNIIRAASNEFNRVARATNERNAEDFVKSYVESNEARYRGVRDLYLAIEDARELGVSELDILSELKKAKVANADLVMQGVFKPSDLNKEIIAEAYREDYDKARNLLPVVDIGVTGQELIQPLGGGFRRERVAPPITRVAQPESVGSQILRQQELDKLVGGT
jgi:hypothetical protein